MAHHQVIDTANIMQAQKGSRDLGSYAPVHRESGGALSGSSLQSPEMLRQQSGEEIDQTSAAGDVRPAFAPTLKLQHGAVVTTQPMTEAEFKQRHRIKKAYNHIDLDVEELSSPSAKVGVARIGTKRQSCLQYMLACAAKREWSFWSTTTFFIACWINITLAVIDIIGEAFIATSSNESYFDEETNSTEFVTVTGYSESENIIYENKGSMYNWLYIISCTMFVINPIFDWLYAFFNQPAYHTQMHSGAFWRYMDTFAWGFWCPAWFFVASSLYLALALDGIFDSNLEEQFILNIWASHIFIVDAVCALIVWRMGSILTKGTQDQVYMFAREFEKIDWCGWGDWLFFFGALVDSSNSYGYELDASAGNRLNFMSAILWTLDCVCYFFADKIAKDQAQRASKILQHTSVATTTLVSIKANDNANGDISSDKDGSDDESAIPKDKQCEQAQTISLKSDFESGASSEYQSSHKTTKFVSELIIPSDESEDDQPDLGLDPGNFKSNFFANVGDNNSQDNNLSDSSGE